ncbi:hypothetical protein BO83DRAFT_377621 [Aspergillus eucalypticola CBS 122712]|uniref:Uncharacterized protein n=1 Tax=Aspergillus eucalypticola (strain CBS 122712 / IBT 29274) TaxID=1448314 RepID=A0A317VSL6_ASPEC|nr:uncharacterized protein BO83DRAFT_377621 [Aspergillus eucalypticola CBS 122712]PWY75912.1 hypothetical protein BO83DRAFT_377621 [Aspergillus eucalypticola CBS 122712]
MHASLINCIIATAIPAFTLASIYIPPLELVDWPHYLHVLIIHLIISDCLPQSGH